MKGYALQETGLQYCNNIDKDVYFIDGPIIHYTVKSNWLPTHVGLYGVQCSMVEQMYNTWNVLSSKFYT